MVTEEAERKAEKIFTENGLEVFSTVDDKPTLAVKQVARAIHAAYVEGCQDGSEHCADQIRTILGL